MNPMRYVLLALSIAAIVSLPTPSVGQPAVSREYTIKAAYLYNFGRYVQWPDDAFDGSGAPLVIGVLGPDPFGDALNVVAQTKQVHGRRIVVRRFASMADYTPCHILFVARSVEPEEQHEAMEKLRGSFGLLVGEAPGFAGEGGAINFFTQQNKIRFEINQKAAAGQGLKISSKLLKLARLVDGGGS